MCWLPQTIRIQQGYSQAFTNHDCRIPQGNGATINPSCWPSHNNWLLQGRSCKLSHNEKTTHFPKMSLSDQNVKNSVLHMKPKVTERRKSELNSLFFEQGGKSFLGFSFVSKGNSWKTTGLGSSRKAAALVPQCLVTISTHFAECWQVPSVRTHLVLMQKANLYRKTGWTWHLLILGG